MINNEAKIWLALEQFLDQEDKRIEDFGFKNPEKLSKSDRRALVTGMLAANENTRNFIRSNFVHATIDGKPAHPEQIRKVAGIVASLIKDKGQAPNKQPQSKSTTRKT